MLDSNFCGTKPCCATVSPACFRGTITSLSLVYSPPPLHLCAKITSGTTAAFFGDASVFPSCFRPPNGRSAAGVAHADAERRRKQAVGAPQRHVVRGRRRWRCRRRRWRGGGAELRRQRRLRLGQLGRGGGGRQQGAWSEAGGGAVLHL